MTLPRTLASLALSLLASGALAWGAETLEDKLKATDLTDAGQVFLLAQWCADNNQPTKAAQYYTQTIKLDPDHSGARKARGEVKVGNRWFSEKFVDKSKTPLATTQAAGAAGAKGPTAAEVQWDLTVMKDPNPDNPFVTTYVDKLPRIRNDSDEMDAAINTILKDDLITSGIPRLCQAMLSPTFGDVYGGSIAAMKLLQPGRNPPPGHTASPKDRGYALALLPFLVKGSEGVTDADDLATFASLMGIYRDKRCTPRLIELLGNASAEVRDAAGMALSLITAIPQTQITPEKALAWWDRNYAMSDQVIFQAQLKSNDLPAAVEAARALIPYQDPGIFPLLAKVLRTEDVAARTRAMQLVQQLSGSDWGIAPGMDKAARGKRVDLLDKWWKENNTTYKWPIPKDAHLAVAAQAGPADRLGQLVKDLGSVTGTVATDAQRELESTGIPAIPVLFTGLDNPAAIVRMRSDSLLKRITGKLDIGYDSGADATKRGTAVAAWREYLTAEKLLTLEGAGEESEEGQTPPP